MNWKRHSMQDMEACRLMHDPYQVADRLRMTSQQRLKLFLAHKGICVVCNTKIDGVKKGWIVEHINPLWLNGTNDIENLGPAHDWCAREKTATEAGERSKGRDVAEKHFGAKRAKTKPMPCGRRSPWKKKMDGSVVKR